MSERHEARRSKNLRAAKGTYVHPHDPELLTSSRCIRDKYLRVRGGLGAYSQVRCHEVTGGTGEGWHHVPAADDRQAVSIPGICKYVEA